MISKKKFEQITRQLANEHVGEFFWPDVKDFAHALIKAVEAESEVVAWRCTNFSHDGNDYAYRDFDDRPVSVSGAECGEPLITLPLVEGESE